MLTASEDLGPLSSWQESWLHRGRYHSGEVLERSASTRRRKWHWTWLRLLKSQSSLLWQSFSNKATPIPTRSHLLIFVKSYHSLVIKNSNIQPYGKNSYSNQHTTLSTRESWSLKIPHRWSREPLQTKKPRHIWPREWPRWSWHPPLDASTDPLHYYSIMLLLLFLLTNHFWDASGKVSASCLRKGLGYIPLGIPDTMDTLSIASANDKSRSLAVFSSLRIHREGQDTTGRNNLGLLTAMWGWKMGRRVAVTGKQRTHRRWAHGKCSVNPKCYP